MNVKEKKRQENKQGGDRPSGTGCHCSTTNRRGWGTFEVASC